MRKLNNIVLLAEFGGGDPIEFARVLMNEHRLPLYYGYTFSCTASSWLKASSKEAETRKHYEAGAWKRLKLNELAADSLSISSPVGVLGLATGEGLGEIELLRNILAEGHTVHYLAIDLSPVLLVTHIETVREVFDQELKEGRLLCAGVVGDVFEDLTKSLCMARAEFKRRGVIAREEEFLADDSLLLMTYLGNCLGNNSAACEKKMFSIITEALTSHSSPLVMIVGVSVMRAEPDHYSPTFSAFLLEIPRYLHKDLEIFRSNKPRNDTSPEEFVIQICTDQCERLPAVAPKSYASNGIEGQIYNFDYRLAFDLEMPSLGLTVPANTTISLYTVTKFRPETLAKSLENDGFTAIYDPSYHRCIQTEFGIREYAVFAAVFPRETPTINK
jgi:hypothetical protein